MSCGPCDQRGARATARRVEWLLAHPKLWENHSVGPLSRKSQRVIFEKMQARGLYSKTTAWYDSSVVNLVKEARRITAKRAEQEFDQKIADLEEEAKQHRVQQQNKQFAAQLLAALSRPVPS